MQKFLFGFLASVFLVAGLTTTPLFAANDPSIKGQQRTDIQNTMRDYIKENQVDGVFVIFDPVKNLAMAHLNFEKLHEGIVTMSGFYISCADFVSADGTPYDIDFMVAQGLDGYRVMDSVIHAVDGKKRTYHKER